MEGKILLYRHNLICKCKVGSTQLRDLIEKFTLGSCNSWSLCESFIFMDHLGSICKPVRRPNYVIKHQESFALLQRNNALFPEKAPSATECKDKISDLGSSSFMAPNMAGQLCFKCPDQLAQFGVRLSR